LSKRRGRPFKEAPPGKRVAICIQVSAEIKAIVVREAKASGCSQSHQAELMIERCLAYERMFDALYPELRRDEPEPEYPILGQPGSRPST
jgi:hypothetical protein